MTPRDTQWPRYQVFHQEQADRPHINAGTVHATDSEMALQNARDVFVRRPDCVSLWVAEARDIQSLTAQELGSEGPPVLNETGGSPQKYLVFLKTSQIGSHEHAGSVEATSALNALAKAVDEFESEKVLVWWVVPEASIARSDPDDVNSLFRPAAGKLYRGQASYHTVTLMRRLREAMDDKP